MTNLVNFIRSLDIDRALSSLDNVIGYYSVAEEVDATVRAGPSAKSLDDYIAVLNRLKNALSYFEKNNPQSVELENVVGDQGFALIVSKRVALFFPCNLQQDSNDRLNYSQVLAQKSS